MSDECARNQNAIIGFFPMSNYPRNSNTKITRWTRVRTYIRSAGETASIVQRRGEER